MRVTAEDYMTIEIFNTAFAQQENVRDMFFNMLQRIVNIDIPDTSKNIKTIPFPALINIIEQNIDILASEGYRPINMEDTIEWLGELKDERKFDYTDVNRWFESLELLEILIHGTVHRIPITGNFTTGSDRTRQVLRKVN